MKRLRKSFFYGSIGGMILYLAEFCCSIVAYISISSPLFEIYLGACIVLGIVTSILSISYKVPSLSWMLFRFILMFLTFSCVYILNGYIGTIRFLYKILGVNINSVNDNTSGMLTVLFLGIVIGLDIVTIVATQIKRMCIKKR